MNLANNNTPFIKYLRCGKRLTTFDIVYFQGKYCIQSGMDHKKLSKMNIPLLITVILILIAVPTLAYVFASYDDNCHSIMYGDLMKEQYTNKTLLLTENYCN
ncbi:MAG TPA: hypothetical protein VF419_01965 [Nitrososphaeraceae archaeon]